MGYAIRSDIHDMTTSKVDGYKSTISFKSQGDVKRQQHAISHVYTRGEYTGTPMKIENITRGTGVDLCIELCTPTWQTWRRKIQAWRRLSLEEKFLSGLG